MSGVGLWLRVTWPLVPLFVVTHAISFLNCQEVEGYAVCWGGHWSWMLSIWSGSTLLVSPLAAASVVAVVVRYFGPQVQEGLPSQAPPWRPVAHICLAVTIHGLVTMLVALAVGCAVCAAYGANPAGLTLPWQVLTGPAALCAAVPVGALVALLLPSAWSVPVVLFGMFQAHMLLFWWGFPELFTIERATWIVDDGRPMPVHLMSTVGLNLVVMAALWLCLRVLGGRPRMRPWRLLLPAAACMAASLAIYLPFVFAGARDTYEHLP